MGARSSRRDPPTRSRARRAPPHGPTRPPMTAGRAAAPRAPADRPQPDWGHTCEQGSPPCSPCGLRRAAKARRDAQAEVRAHCGDAPPARNSREDLLCREIEQCGKERRDPRQAPAGPEPEGRAADDCRGRPRDTTAARTATASTKALAPPRAEDDQGPPERRKPAHLVRKRLEGRTSTSPRSGYVHRRIDGADEPEARPRSGQARTVRMSGALAVTGVRLRCRGLATPIFMVCVGAVATRLYPGNFGGLDNDRWLLAGLYR